MPRFVCLAAVLAVGLAAFFYLTPTPDTSAKPGDKPRKDWGIDKRVPWTTSNVKGSPEPPSPYLLENAFPKLKFENPIDLAVIPGSKRLAIAQQHGKLFTFANRRDAAEAQPLLTIKSDVYSIAFHPKAAENGYLFVTAIQGEGKDANKVLRFKLKKTDVLEADPASETTIIAWNGGGHTGGCVRFGPDGYLYVAVGDGSGIADQLESGQRIDDLHASILRIDIDHPQAGKNYGIPKDNPFVDMKDARPEIWAYGLRQPWRFSFDRATGDLWAGEVGQDLWESVHRIEKGGNYGWSVMEGTHPFRPLRPKGPTPILPPIIEHNHHEFRSLTGGYIYHGTRLKELQGAYIYGDYDTGRVWTLRYDAKVKKVTDHRELTDTQLRIVAWGEDADGELYAVDHQGGGLHRIIPAPPPLADPPKFPRKLSETGLFASTKDHTPAPGVLPYSVNAELWSDGATKQRFMAIPGDATIDYNAMTYPQPAPGAQPGWRFPNGTVFVKTFSLGDRRLETRLLVGERVAGNEEVGDQVWLGYTYLWNDDQTDAELIDSKGLDKAYSIADAKAPGGKRDQTWHFPSRTECTLCHTMSAKYVLGMNTLQANRDHEYGDCVANQLATFDHLGLFSKPLADKPEKASRLVDYRDPAQDLDARARSYLHANCSHCHRKWGGGNAEFQLLFALPLKETGITNVTPAHGEFDLKDARLLAPGDPDHSLVLHRMNKLGLGRMPHVASNVIDAEGVALIREWIQKMPR
ncbi:MAG TPA: PQQ-dependent sugar dehydrogenase [Gemmataceae bacterium]|jgi:uncharacterized repeat protein (TIGR03806 family)|nr:PQQ-dependent sugar dehydrogenase [Gemmataceae bacterium]